MPRQFNAAETWALNCLGMAYEGGHGVPQDYDKAMEFYLAASKQKYSRAEYNVGLLIYNGKGVQRDFATARSWFEIAAAHGSPDAMAGLGVMYERGEGVD